MIKLVVFDLDNTLARLGKGICPKDIALLRELEKKGMRIAICSGKPCYYLCGFMRQVELDAPILVGENGAEIFFGVDLPPKRYYTLPHSEQARRSIRLLKDAIDAKLPDMWYQPNAVALTPFPASAAQFDTVQACIDENREALADITVYRHVDSFDIVPLGIDKKKGLAFLAKLIGIPASETASVGDGVNDYPMFEYAALAIGVNVADEKKVHRNFSCVTDALHYLSELAKGS